MKNVSSILVCIVFMLVGTNTYSQDALWFELGAGWTNNDLVSLFVGANWMHDEWGAEIYRVSHTDMGNSITCVFGSGCDERLTVKEAGVMAKYGLFDNQLLLGVGTSLVTMDYFYNSKDDEFTGNVFSVRYRTKSMDEVGLGITLHGNINGEDNYTGIKFGLELGRRYQ